MTLRELKNKLKNNAFIRLVVYARRIIRSPKKFIRYIKARLFFRKMLQAKRDDEVYLILGGAIGDNVYGIAYLDELRKKFPDKKIIAFSTQLNYGLLKSYKEIDEVNMSLEVHENLRDLLLFSMPSTILWKYSESNMCMAIPSLYDDVRRSSQKATLFNMRRIYRIKDDSEITYHSLTKVPLKSIQDFEHIKNRIVIIHPYPHYREQYNEDVYIPICEELKRRGYIAFTNVIKEQEPVKGTEALRCGIEELYSIACDVPLIVSERGGILDLMIPSGINMFVIYGSNNELEFFPLSEWKGKNRIEEVIVNDLDENSLRNLHERFESFLDELEQEGKLS